MAEPRDDKVSAAFRAMPAAEPPPALDDAIRAAARRAVRSKPDTPLRRWAVPASVAAVLALSIGIAMHVDWRKPLVVDGTPVPSGSGEYPVTQAPAEAPPPRFEVSKAKPDAQGAAGDGAVTAPRSMPSEAVAERREVKREAAAAPAAAPPAALNLAPATEPAPKTPGPQAASTAAPEAFPASPAPAQAPTVPAVAPAPAPAAAPSPPAMARMQSGAVASAPRPAAPSAAADQASAEVAPMRAKQEAAGARVVKEAVAPTPEKQLERIAELRAAGRHAEADEALAKFRREYPDYRVPPETWEKVKPR